MIIKIIMIIFQTTLQAAEHCSRYRIFWPNVKKLPVVQYYSTVYHMFGVVRADH